MAITFAPTVKVKPAPIVIGIDPSTSTGVIVLQGTKVLAQATIHFPDLKGIARVRKIGMALQQLLWPFLVDGDRPTVFMEGYAYGNSFSLATLVEVGTAIRLQLEHLGLEWFTVSPTMLKKWTTGTSKKVDKKVMARFAKSRWGFEPTREKGKKADDVVDAYALARMGQAFMAGEPGMTDDTSEEAKKIPFRFARLGSATQN